MRLRVRDPEHPKRRRILDIPAHTFIERFLLHVLPKGFKRIRHYGLLGPARKAAKLAQARAALSAPIPDRPLLESLEAFMQRIDRLECSRCAHCGIGHFVTTASIAPTPARAPPPCRPP